MSESFDNVSKKKIVKAQNLRISVPSNIMSSRSRIEQENNEDNMGK